jgi:hypothetical protein
MHNTPAAIDYGLLDDPETDEARFGALLLNIVRVKQGWPAGYRREGIA